MLNDAAEHILALACGYHPEIRNRKAIVMLQGYVDDSGSHGKDLFVLAGYVLPVPKWIEFSTDWAQELAKEPTIQYFKSYEAQWQTDEFKGLEKEICNYKIQNLSRVIEKHRPFCLCTCLEWNDYREVFSGQVPPDIDNPYFILFYSIIEQMLHCQQENGLYEKVDFTFDEQGKLGDIATRFYEFIKSNCSPEIREMLGSTPIFRDDKEVVALQAADMLAWQVHRKGVHPNEPRPILKLITSGSCEKLGKEYLRTKLSLAKS